MTPDSVRKYKTEIAALGDGKTIQILRRNSAGARSDWTDTINPSFEVTDYVEFRIKPPTSREFWIVNQPGYSALAFDKQAHAEHELKARILGEIIHCKEVL